MLHNIVDKEKFLQAWEYINESNVNQQPQSLRTQDLDHFNASIIRDTLNTYLVNNFELRTFQS